VDCQVVNVAVAVSKPMLPAHPNTWDAIFKGNGRCDCPTRVLQEQMPLAIQETRMDPLHSLHIISHAVDWPIGSLVKLSPQQQVQVPWPSFEAVLLTAPWMLDSQFHGIACSFQALEGHTIGQVLMSSDLHGHIINHAVICELTFQLGPFSEQAN
jgi:hypothetical protein